MEDLLVQTAGQDMYNLAVRLFPICRSLTGDGVRQSLSILKEIVPQMKLYEVPSGTKVFDWEVPQEWNVKDAYIEDMEGKRVISFSDNNLHLMGYSLPIDCIVTRDELLTMIYTEPSQPDAIPYVTSYYEQRSGFCMSENQKHSLDKDRYHIVIDSELKDGNLTYGEILISGDTEQEIFLSTYICHPSMANNELSGPCVAIYLARWLLSLGRRRYSYRIIFIPETIGSITYLSKNLEVMKKNIVAGFNISCVGDDRCYSYLPSRRGHTLADRVALNVLKNKTPLNLYTYMDRGSDERQYCSPGVDLPVCSVMRSKYGEYPEYHTSADNLDIISPEGLAGAYEVYQDCIFALENNCSYKVTCFCEPQLGKRGLHPTISKKGKHDESRAMMDFIAYADGANDLIRISDIINVPIKRVIEIAESLKDAGLIEIVKH